MKETFCRMQAKTIKEIYYRNLEDCLNIPTAHSRRCVGFIAANAFWPSYFTFMLIYVECAMNQSLIFW
jgi:hypothetical protein